MSTHNLHPGTTMVPEALRSCQVVTEKIDSNEVVIDGDQITGITQDPSNEDPTKLPSSHVLSKIKTYLDNKIDNLDFKVDSIVLNPVMSDPLLDEYFYGSYWEKTEDVILDNGKAQFTNKQESRPNQAQIRIPTEAINKAGKYFFAVTVEELPSGDITIANEKQEVIKIITDPGDYYFETVVENPSIAFFTITINYMLELDTCVISFFSLNYVKNIFDTYMDYKVREYAFGNMTKAIEELRNEVKTAITDMQNYVKLNVDNFTTLLAMHRNNKNNPHNVTYQQIVDTLNK